MASTCPRCNSPVELRQAACPSCGFQFRFDETHTEVVSFKKKLSFALPYFMRRQKEDWFPPETEVRTQYRLFFFYLLVGAAIVGAAFKDHIVRKWQEYRFGAGTVEVTIINENK